MANMCSIVLIINCLAYAIATNVLIILRVVLSIRCVPYSTAYSPSGTSLVSAISSCPFPRSPLSAPRLWV